RAVAGAGGVAVGSGGGGSSSRAAPQPSRPNRRSSSGGRDEGVPLRRCRWRSPRRHPPAPLPPVTRVVNDKGAHSTRKHVSSSPGLDFAPCRSRLAKRAVQAADGPREGLNPPAERIDITTFRPTPRTPGTRKDGAPCPCRIVPPSSI